MTGSNTTPLEPRGGGGLSSRVGGATSGPSLLNPSYLSGGGAVVPLGQEIKTERKRPAERESRFDVKESREER